MQVFICTSPPHSLRPRFLFGVQLGLITGGGGGGGRRRRDIASSLLSSSLSLLILRVQGFFWIGIDWRIVGGGNCSGGGVFSWIWELARLADGLVLEGWVIFPIGVVAFVCDLELCILLEKKKKNK